MIETEIDVSTFRSVLGHYPTGVVAITALNEAGKPTGMVVGTFTSVSLNPPLVGFLPDKNSITWPVIQKSQHFCVNVLASDQGAVCRQLSQKGADKFADVKHSTSYNGLPVIDGALSAIDCRIHAVLDAGDHWFVLGKVLDLSVLRKGDPMLFFCGQYGGFADARP